MSNSKNEHQMWVTLKGLMGHRWHAQRHEDRLSCGIPDLSYAASNQRAGWVHGWLELKSMPKWPKNELSILKIKHYTPVQRSWIYSFGPRVFLLLRVESTWMLFDYRQAQSVGKMTKRGLEEEATKIWVGNPNPDELLDFLVGNR